jgi:hypothetical protein
MILYCVEEAANKESKIVTYKDDTGKFTFKFTHIKGSRDDFRFAIFNGYKKVIEMVKIDPYDFGSFSTVMFDTIGKIIRILKSRRAKNKKLKRLMFKTSSNSTIVIRENDLYVDGNYIQ